MIKFSKKYFHAIVAVSLVLIVVLSAYILYNHFSGQVVWRSDDGAAVKKTYQYFSQLDGSGQESSSGVSPAVIAAMIDNHPDARPQSGVEKAPIVYEVPVEGGITRLMAVFPAVGAEVGRLGPIRSARPYFLDWLAEYGDAVYMHSGGSPEALSLIKERGVFDANEFWWGEYYWRDDARSAPHNLYTSSANWQKLFADRSDDRGSKQWTGWKFGERSDAFTPLKKITIKYSPGNIVSWDFDAGQGGWVRSVNGEQVNGVSVVAQNVIVQMMTVKSIDDADRKSISTIGSGEARVLRDGMMARGRWVKETLQSRTVLLDSAGSQIALSPGSTWVQIVPKDAMVEVTN